MGHDERQSADLIDSCGSCRRHDSRRPLNEGDPLPSVRIGLGGISGQSPQTFSKPINHCPARKLGVGRARTRHVRQSSLANLLLKRKHKFSYRSMARHRRTITAWNHAEGLWLPPTDVRVRGRRPDVEGKKTEVPPLEVLHLSILHLTLFGVFVA